MKGNFYIEASEKMREIQEEREKLLMKSADTVSMVIMKMNQKGITDMSAIQKDINNLLSGFSDSEKVCILERTISKLVLNM